MPCHAVSELVDADLPLAVAPTHARHGELSAVDDGYGDHGTASASAGAGAGAGFKVRVVVVEEAGSVGGWRGVLHLHREPGAGVYGASLAEGVWDLVGIDGVEGGADTDALLLDGLVDDDEFGLLGLGDIAEEGETVVFFGLGLGGYGVGVEGYRCPGFVHGWSHGGTAYRRVWWVTTRVALEDMTLADIMW